MQMMIIFEWSKTMINIYTSCRYGAEAETGRIVRPGEEMKTAFIIIANCKTVTIITLTIMRRIYGKLGMFLHI